MAVFTSKSTLLELRPGEFKTVESRFGKVAECRATTMPTSSVRLSGV